MAAMQESVVFRGLEELSADTCLGIARRKLGSPARLALVNVAMAAFSDTPVGFLGDHYKVKMTIRRLDTEKRADVADSKSIDLHFFVKTKPSNQSYAASANSMGAFEKERDFFTVLLVLLRQYVSGEQAGAVPVAAWTTNFYHASARLIVLDDLSRQGFRMLDNRAVMDYNHCAVLFKTLARFHASSIIFEEKESQRLGAPLRLNDAFPQMFKETIWSKEAGNSGRQICEGGIKAMLTLIKRMPRLTHQPERYESVCASLGKLFDDVCQLVAASNEYKNVVCHGDLWANNILFKYDASGRNPEDARLVDFQLLRYTAPAHDFVCALYLNTRRAMRDKHLLDLALVYHSALAAALGQCGLDVEELIPWSRFEASVAHYRRLGVLTCCMYFPASLLPPRAAKELFADPERFARFMLDDRSEVASACFDTDQIFTERITEIAEELADLSQMEIQIKSD